MISSWIFRVFDNPPREGFPRVASASPAPDLSALRSPEPLRHSRDRLKRQAYLASDDWILATCRFQGRPPIAYLDPTATQNFYKHRRMTEASAEIHCIWSLDDLYRFCVSEPHDSTGSKGCVSCLLRTKTTSDESTKRFAVIRPARAFLNLPETALCRR